MADRYWVGGSGQWQAGNTAVWSASPTLTPTGASVPTTSDNVFFTNAATYTVTVTATAFCGNLTVSAGAPNINLSTTSSRLTIAGSLDFTGSSAGATISGSSTTLGIIFGDSSIPGSYTITSAGRSLGNMPIQFGPTSLVDITWTLQDAFACSGAVQHNRAGLNLNNQTFTCGTITWPSISSKTLAFGSSGQFILTGSGAVATMTSANAPAITTGNPTFTLTYSGVTATTFAVFLFLSLNVTAGGYTLTYNSSASLGTNNLNFTGFSGVWTRTFAFTLYGNLTLSSTMTNPTSAQTMTFGATSGTQVITSNGRTIDFAMTQNGVGGTVLLADALAMGTRALTLTNGTFDGGGYSITGSAAITMVTGSVTAKNINTARAITHTSGTLTFGANNTTGAYTFNAGTLDLAGYQLNPSTFTSNGTGVRTLAFSTGNITCTGSGGTLFNSTSSTNLTVTGTPVVNIPYSGAVATTIAAFPNTEAQSISFNIQAGTYALTMIDASRAYRNVNFTGFSGTLGALGATGVKIYGSLTLSSTMTLTSIANTLTFAGTSTGNTITTAGKVIGYKLAFDGVGGSWILQDALTISGTNCNVRHYNGTLDLNGKTLTLAPETNSYFTDPGTKNITFNGGTIIATNDFNNANPTGFTTTAGTGVGKISIQKATGFSFTGGGSTYNCTISNDGAGALSLAGNNTIQTLTTTVGNITLTGSNTITTIANAVQPVTFTFAISTTQTITNWNVSGTAGNLVTIVSSSAGTAATLSKASGTVSANYLSLKDSAATGGAAWYAGANSTNVSGNSGWIFANAPAGAFFAIF